MILITAVDNHNGLRFNKRRLSKDASLIARIELFIKDQPLCMMPFSETLFTCKRKIINSPAEVGSKEYFFVEEEVFVPDINQLDQLILYKWNRDYPSDEKLNIDFTDFKLVSTNDFVGKSHECITEEVYVKNENL